MPHGAAPKNEKAPIRKDGSLGYRVATFLRLPLAEQTSVGRRASDPAL